MKWSIITVIFSFILMSNILCVQEEDKILVLTDDNFDKEIKEKEYLLVEFYAPWCGHCKSLAPEYSKAAEVLRGEQFKDSPIYLGKVDATINPALAQKFSIEGFPTLKFFKDGEFFKDYDGGRTAEDIVTWIKKRTSPASKELKSIEEIEQFKKEGDVVVIFFGEKNSNSYRIFLRVSHKFDDVLFAHVTNINAELLSHFQIKPNQVLLFKNFDEGRNKFNAEIEEDSLLTFINYYSLPLISKFDERAAEAIFARNKAGLFLIRSEKNPEHSKYEDVLKAIGDKYKEKIIFVVTDIVGEIEEKLAEYFGVQESNLPHLRIVDVKGEEDVRNYVLTQEINKENVEKFINDSFEDKLPIYVKSEEIPKEQTEAVFKLVGKNFKEIVYDPKRNVLVEFYAPWCGHCKQLAPIYEKLAEHFKNDTSVLIAKIDATANDFDDTMELQGYPSIKMFLAGDKPNTYPADYIGNREFEDLVKFVEGLIHPERAAMERERLSSTIDNAEIPKKEQEEEDEEEEDLNKPKSDL